MDEGVCFGRKHLKGDLCPPVAVSLVKDVAVVDDELCTNCDICIKVCPMGAPYEVN